MASTYGSDEYQSYAHQLAAERDSGGGGGGSSSGGGGSTSTIQNTTGYGPSVSTYDGGGGGGGGSSSGGGDSDTVSTIENTTGYGPSVSTYSPSENEDSGGNDSGGESDTTTTTTTTTTIIDKTGGTPNQVAEAGISGGGTSTGSTWGVVPEAGISGMTSVVEKAGKEFDPIHSVTESAWRNSAWGEAPQAEENPREIIRVIDDLPERELDLPVIGTVSALAAGAAAVGAVWLASRGMD